MNNLSLDELKAVREGLEYALVSSNRQNAAEAIKKVDEMLANFGWKFERRAFQNTWKKIQSK
jgi:hypothetical protein